MHVIYYQYAEKSEEKLRTYLVCVNGALPSSKSPIWRCNTSVWLVPGTENPDRDTDEQEY